MFDIEIITKTVYGYILCFDPSIDTSFHEALTLIDSLEVEDKPVVLAACKTDILPFNIRPEWSTEAAARGWKIIGTSSKNNKGITRLFEEIFKIVLKEDETVLGRLEYATDLMSSCIYTSINNYIYEFVQEIADALNITFYEAGGLLLLAVFVLLCIIYQCCVKPCIDCLKCGKAIIC